MTAIVEKCSLSEVRFVSTAEADGRHFLNFLSHWDQIQDWAKWITLEVAVQTCYYHCLSLMSYFIYDLRQRFSKELGFIDADYVGVTEFLRFKQLEVQVLGYNCGFEADLVVCYYAAITPLIPPIT